MIKELLNNHGKIIESEIVEGQEIQIMPKQTYIQLFQLRKGKQRVSLEIQEKQQEQSQESIATSILDQSEFDLFPMNRLLSDERSRIFAEHTHEISMYLHAKFVIEELVEPLLSENILSHQSLFDVQLLYLLTFRAWCDINWALKKFNLNASPKPSRKNKIKMSKKPKPRIAELNFEQENLLFIVKPMHEFNEKVDKLFEKYHEFLTYKEQRFSQKIRLVFTIIFYNSWSKQKQKFLCGYEGLDFPREQQISFIEEYYLPTIRERIAKKNKQKLVSLDKKTRIVKSLLNSKMARMSFFDDYERRKQKLLLKIEAKNLAV